MVGGLGAACGKIRPRRVGTRWGSDISPADLNDMMPVPLLISSPFECDVKQTRPPCFFFEKKKRKIKKREEKQFNIRFAEKKITNFIKMEEKEEEEEFVYE